LLWNLICCWWKAWNFFGVGLCFAIWWISFFLDLYIIRGLLCRKTSNDQENIKIKFHIKIKLYIELLVKGHFCLLKNKHISFSSISLTILLNQTILQIYYISHIFLSSLTLSHLFLSSQFPFQTKHTISDIGTLILTQYMLVLLLDSLT
jgi:hypothetical protein